MCTLAAETKSARLGIVGFQARVTGLEQRISSMENKRNTVPNRDQELLNLCSKLINLEDRSRRDNVCFFSFLEQLEGSTLPTLTDLTFVPPLEFQRAHRLGPQRQDGAARPCPIITYLLRHRQARKLILAAQAHGPYRAEGYEVRIASDYTKDTSDRRKAFLALLPQLRQMDVKYGLF
ncbi:hypothetical protein NDU88_006561 [Pleurodeles waltl]|uniref:Hexosyltransferase n=1 Tax=Pleurodeles waltl TaxID=8319 RepID=A0AAV7NZP8_PLEWA|nr:hypothetical protein NDU88_006561 [Pleurodeles waltl]